ncbi:MAG: hypothetical protein M1825_002307 [Sarcosagium campestre]|nr:MAG: hypothetical protein M1825_002307 [Sarcosagium campestre]
MPSLGRLSSLAIKCGLSSRRPRVMPRAPLAAGFDAIGQDRLVEEEAMPEYRPEHIYPVRLGEVFNDRFQIVAKFGYGSSSTIWLARDLHRYGHHQYVALKIYIHNSVQHREPPFYQHLEKVLPTQHPGDKNVRKLLASFQVTGPHGKHVALALQVFKMSIRDMDLVFMDGRGFDEGFVKGAVKELLEALDFLHTEVQYNQCTLLGASSPYSSLHPHTRGNTPSIAAETCSDVDPGNLLLGTDDDSIFQKLEDNEFSSPVPRKQCEGRTIYLSRLMKPKAGPLLLSDFEEARLGPGPHAGDTMPVMHGISFLEERYSAPANQTAASPMELTSPNSLQRWAHRLEGFSIGIATERSSTGMNKVRIAEAYSGNWSEFVPIPREKTLAAAETKLEDNTKFLQFMRRALTWDLAARPTAKKLLQDPWLNT